MENIKISKTIKNFNFGTIEIPGSKSITNRVLCLAAFSGKQTQLENILLSDDTVNCLNSLKNLGFEYELDTEKQTVIFTSTTDILKKHAEIDIGSAGTSARFLPSILANFQGTWKINCSQQMSKRPMQELFESLESSDLNIEYLNQNYHLPIILNSNGIPKDKFLVDGSRSSQFVSSLLIGSSFNPAKVTVTIKNNLIAKPYIDITLNVLKKFGIEWKNTGYKEFVKNTVSVPFCKNYFIEPDVSSACYFCSIPLLCNGKIKIKNIFKSSIQGDIKFLEVLEKFGCTIYEDQDGLNIECSKDSFRGIDIDMKDFSDQALTVAVLSIFATSPTRIRNINHLEFQESKRITACLTQLNKLEIKTERTEDGIIIYPGTPKANTIIETYDDHRMAMAFSLIGLRTPIVIENPKCCNKTFPKYFELFDSVTGIRL